MTEKSSKVEYNPSIFSQARVNVISLLESLVPHPKDAFQHSIRTFIQTFLVVTICYAFVHSSIMGFGANAVEGLKGYEVETFSISFIRILLSSIGALILSTAGVCFLWFITAELTFEGAFKRFMFYYITVVLLCLLGELFLCRIIIESNTKLQPFVALSAGTSAIILLNRALEEDEQIRISLPMITFILALSYLQSYMLVDDVFGYYNQAEIESPLFQYIRKFFKMIFGTNSLNTNNP
ncbi:MAG: hypothetical protein ACFFCQ_15880 [Promethearchaeota archaeon]